MSDGIQAVLDFWFDPACKEHWFEPSAAFDRLVADRLASTPGVRAMRDATRGGVATILNEVAKAAEVAVVVDEAAVPVGTEVRGASELLGIDPLYVASEGRIVVFVDGASADPALAAAQRTT